ncbi:sensor domain-containing diguanylate cyclase [Bacillus sp. DTU_2020_1000418_1_SI_GHA_SEK_038]|uniref:sensor domain-containing diguanylate cyclase n=1 Tax=Bacillus sp. DTU_2020_1000418_1_SI_GHA_SEK_038 TaxID=3077585 RepID=UPI0028E50263|nr:sensor domain-containing diguanylate cyclase [Bacillus sp. DTU_2020_1000418_1_SI_GHA_SEK_038]WNS74474.1 sensor domain-containing diguanylate cyclase [Bacillus sp. DTU_2020_1000418_1_SI_GHA_SEK_038]
MISAIKKKMIWGLWLFIFPPSLWLIYQLYPPHIAGHEIDIIVFLILAFFVAATPMIINGSPIFLIQWVAWAVFLTFGLFVELIILQLTIIVLFIRVKLPKEQFFRIPLNSLMFMFVSFLSGATYYMLGGSPGARLADIDHSFWLIPIYPILYYVFNHFFIWIINLVLYNGKRETFGIDFIWETITTIITFPMGFVLFILYKELGLVALIFVGIPFASLSVILNLYYSSRKINKLLQSATEIGHQLAERLNVDEVLDLFIQKLTEMLPVDYAYILDIIDNEELQIIRQVEKGVIKCSKMEPLRKSEGISGLVWQQKKAALFSSQKEWKNIVKGYMPDKVESVLSMPIVRNSEAVGVLFLASSGKRAYEKSQLMIVDILCSHFAIALENARNYEKTKAQSERCALTKLYNYRYFENFLSTEFEKILQNVREEISLIILDIDHFKAVNDMYGHQSGNEILCQLADVLMDLIGDKGMVARYGGEEFVILLPDVKKSNAVKIAETVRQAIANHPFLLTQHIDKRDQPQQVHITGSIGVASAPQDADEPLALIRHADRALYVGAKRAGRNRVAEYVK